MWPKVRSGRVGSTPRLHAQGLAGFEALEDLRLTDEFLGADFMTFNCSAGDMASLFPRGRGGGRKKRRGPEAQGNEA
jgi:hypothetical protein